MLPLIAPLLLIGIFSPSNSVHVSEDKEPRERFITLRDYDFVGEDATLAAQLARRMRVLQAPLNLSELSPRAAPRGPDLWRQWKHDPIQFKPDYLESRLKLPQLVNVSLDYAEIYNASDLTHDTNASSPALDPKPVAAAALGPDPGSALVPSPGATLVPGPYAAVALDVDRAVDRYPYEGPNPNLDEGPGPNSDKDKGPGPELSPGATPAPNVSARLDLGDGRRQVINRASDFNNFKVLDLMKHNIYGTQRKILELDIIIKKYMVDPRFRMAYIYDRLDEWMRNLRTLYYAAYRPRYYHLRIKSLIWYYNHALRIDIDITYSIEHLLHLHTEYTKKMELIVPLSTRQELEAAKKQQRKLEKMRQMGFPEGYMLT